MKTITISYRDNKVKNLLQDLEKLGLIRVVCKDHKRQQPLKKEAAREGLGSLLSELTLVGDYRGLDAKTALEKVRRS